MPETARPAAPSFLLPSLTSVLANLRTLCALRPKDDRLRAVAVDVAALVERLGDQGA